jgi:hypothetical protein
MGIIEENPPFVDYSTQHFKFQCWCSSLAMLLPLVFQELKIKRKEGFF